MNVNTVRHSTYRFRPALERLEDRCCPSTITDPALLGIEVSGHTLTLTGDNTGNTVLIGLEGNGDVLAIISGANGAAFKYVTGIDTIRYLGGSGNDQVRVSEMARLNTNLNLQLDMGNGNDWVNLGFQSGIAGHSLNLDVNGGSGQDQVSFQLGEVRNANVNLNVGLHGQGDSFAAWLNGSLTGHSNVNLDVDGGAGGDALSFQADKVQIGTNASLEADFNGGSGNDAITMSYDGRIQGRLALHANGGDGDDVIKTIITADPNSTGQLDVQVNGGAGNDDLTVYFYDESSLTSEAPLAPGAAQSMLQVRSLLSSVNIEVDGGPGIDTLHRTPNVTDIQNVEVIDPLVIPF